ncbi:MAG: triose-phosphate isomerase [Clostridiales bacterium]|jgi:triosephosphate isomerase|nr:triose-phosphate isomerase [Clostridiales bacterium]
MRKKMIIGNWKMNMTPNECKSYINFIKNKIDAALEDNDIILCVPSVDFIDALKCVENTKIMIGAQNIYFEKKGAFTGEISIRMIKELGINYTILGHSERRNIFSESEELINKKVRAAVENSINPIVCIGESEKQNSKFSAARFIKIQTGNVFVSINTQQAKKITIAYEPVWAIGTKSTPTLERIQEVCYEIRNNIVNLYGQLISEQIRIIYGGSVDSKNIKEIINLPDVDGVLVGSASITPEFISIVNYQKT